MPKRSRSNRKQSLRPASANSRSTILLHSGQSRIDGLIAAGLIMLVTVAYVQVLRFQFVNYDDTVYVPDNPQIRTGFSLSGIGWAFTTFETANWYPLTWLSLMLDCQVFGPWPGGHHAVNAALHATNSVLLFAALRRMTGLRWPSAAVSALFAVHPLHVESVAWIAERKDVLSTFFFLSALWAYQRYVAVPGVGRWFLVLIAMVLGLMSKSMLVTLPMVLLLLDFWPLRRVAGTPNERLPSNSENEDSESQISDLKYGRCGPPPAAHCPPSTIRRLLLEKLPLLALSLAASIVTLAAQASKGATTMLHDRADLPLRLANAAIVFVKYVAMSIWPVNLAVYYPYDFHPSSWEAASAMLLVLALTAGSIWCVWQNSRQYHDASNMSGAHCLVPAAVGWLWYVVTLVPVIGLVQVGSQGMADRYCYIPSIGIYIAFVWTVGDLARWLMWRSRKRGIVFAAGSSVILAALLVVAHHQASYWVDSERLFRHALAITDENPVACENLGDALLHQEKFVDAEVQFRKVLAMDAEHYRQTVRELAQVLAGQGRVNDAIAFLEQTISEKSEMAMAKNSLALFLAPRHHVIEAIELLREAIRLAPEQPMAARNLAWIFATCPDRRFRNGSEAVKLARQACELSQWSNAQCRQTLADAYLETGDVDRAIEELRAAIRLAPTDTTAAKKLESISPGHR